MGNHVLYNKVSKKNQHYLIIFTQFGQTWGIKQSHYIFAKVVLDVCASIQIIIAMCQFTSQKSKCCIVHRAVIHNQICPIAPVQLSLYRQRRLSSARLRLAKPSGSRKQATGNFHDIFRRVTMSIMTCFAGLSPGPSPISLYPTKEFPVNQMCCLIVKV